MIDSTGTSPLLEMRGLSKAFPGVRALHDVDLELGAGEVLALIGENGAGKSTLIKILGGAYQPDAGTIRILGRDPHIGSPADAIQAGIGVIYQEFNLVPGLSARENIFLGHENTQAGWIQRREETRKAKQLFERIGVAVDLETPCHRLSVAQKQVVEIAKALSRDVRILVMDEPTAALTPQEVSRLLAIVRDLKEHGIGIIYISHRLDEVYSVADRTMVLRDGEHVGTWPTAKLERTALIEAMVGRKIENEFPKHRHELGPVRLQVRQLCRPPMVQDVSFSLHAGEVLGLTGLVGAGRTEVARAIFGADRLISGEILLDGNQVTIRSPRDAIQAGICLLSEDRKSEGLVLGSSARENFGLPNLAHFANIGWIQQRRERSAFARYTGELSIKLASPEQKVRNLSGGNQQKVVLAKWLDRNSDVVLFDEPTRGIDVGAKYEIYLLINELARQGKAILMISSELPEVLGMSDRILVMHEGRITGEIQDVESATQEQILTLAVG